ncbi:hypothetical protein TBR22_A31460 [Luteitalea sp. TBR-22]|uniref:VWA domain-containing protein n=1 Tax=Luteitalea sp. TBR-22 TaxID=2802971 RepID=UPI001AFA7996|nr:VWA domain-containing protein [Luteitalea sp. TBR-22]BCS33918.1 hypothetical protein TBR22_A31460 [Luteitalea sp. TBR-22]
MILPFAQRAFRPIALISLLASVTVLTGSARQFSARTDLVEVYATVTDEEGRFVTDLRREEFTVLEDGVPQAISTFADGDQPVSIALAIDRSASMDGGRLEAAQRAGREMLLELGAQDKAMLVAIGSEVEVSVPLTDDRRAVDAALQALDPWGSTALHDAIVTAFDAIERAPGRRALVLVSDGRERHSRRSADDVLARVRASDVLAYPVVLEREKTTLFAQVAAMTGGQALRVARPRELPAVLRRIATELRHQYLLGYQPARPQVAGEYRAIEVRVGRRDHRVRARAGYIAR